MTQEAENISHSTIISYMNTPFMVSFDGTKETDVKFIISWYHNRKFYFNKPIEISNKVIYKLIRLSNTGDPVPIGIKDGLVKRLTGTLIGKNLSLIVSQIRATTPKIIEKIVSTGLTVVGRGCDLKIEMLEVVDTIATSGKFYYWDQYVADMLKIICEKCQENGAVIRFPSLII